MAVQAAVTVFDGNSTPTSHTFSPVGVRLRGDVWEALWRENFSGVPVDACPRLSITMQRLKSGLTRVGVRFEVPVMESISGQNSGGYTAAPKVAYTTVSELNEYVHGRSSNVDRRLARMLPINFGNNVSTSVAASATGFVTDAIDNLLMPS
jgi:hypothetical protein